MKLKNDNLLEKIAQDYDWTFVNPQIPNIIKLNETKFMAITPLIVAGIPTQASTAASHVLIFRH